MRFYAKLQNQEEQEVQKVNLSPYPKYQQI